MNNFFKYEGLGNDFLLIENAPFPPEDVQRLCDRHFGIGADGIIFFKRFAAYAEMQIRNSDGSYASMCANGLRCLAKCLHEQFDIDPIEIHCNHQIYHCTIEEGQVSVLLDYPKWIEQNCTISLNGEPFVGSLIDAGTPHFLFSSLDPYQFPEDVLGALRFHPHFQTPVNVSVYHQVDHDRYLIKTFEKGLIEPSLSCGTAAISCAFLHASRTPCKVVFPQNLVLEFSYLKQSMRMKGPARGICSAQLLLQKICL